MKSLKWCVVVVVLLVAHNGFSTVLICGNHTYPDGHTARVCHYFYAKDTKCDSADMLAIVSQPGGFTGGWTCKSANFLADINNDGLNLVRSQDGQAYFLVNGEKTQIASDALIDFMRQLNRQASNSRMNTENIRRQFEDFMDTDNGYVSDARLTEVSEALGVAITNESSLIPKNDAGRGRGRTAVDH